MSRIAAAATAGQSNRRFILLAVVLGLVGAILVYVAFSRDSSPDSSAGIPTTPVVVAKADIPARSRITASMIDVKLVAEDSASALSFNDPETVIGQVTRFPIAANEQVLSTKIVSLAPNAQAGSRALSYVVPQGKRGFAINASQVQEAGGLVLPGDYVDVLVIYDVEFTSRAGDKETEDNFLVQTIFQNIEVLAVSQTVVDLVPEATPTAGGQRARNSEAKADPEAITVTLALTSDQVQRMYLAESNGRVRLALRPFGDSEERPVDFITELELFPQNLPNPFLR